MAVAKDVGTFRMRKVHICVNDLLCWNKLLPNNVREPKLSVNNFN